MSLKLSSPLNRYPFKKNDTLQAWDSADELILEYLDQLNLDEKKILILNDSFGALSCSLTDFDCETYTDSYVSMMGISQNSLGKIQVKNDLTALSGLYDYILIKIPKNLSFFEDILCTIGRHCGIHSQIICGSMIKHLSTGSFELINKYIGSTTTSLAKKKARLIFANFEKLAVPNPYPMKVNMDSFQKPFTHYSNLFSREKLDIGTRFFLDHIPKGDYKTILDLGCANGIVGIKAKMINPQAKLIFSDDSAMAIKSAKENYQLYFQDEAEYLWTNCFEKRPPNILDLVLCNPPFHHGTTLGDHIAWQMFNDSYNSLRPGGRLRVIGNSHLGYQMKLRRLFGNSCIIASNNKFTICEAIK